VAVAAARANHRGLLGRPGRIVERAAVEA